MSIEQMIVIGLPISVIGVIIFMYYLFMRSKPNELPNCTQCKGNDWDKTDCPHIYECSRCHHRQNYGLDEDEEDSL